MIQSITKSSSSLTTATLLTLHSFTPFFATSNDIDLQPRIERVFYVENTATPKISEFQEPKVWTQESVGLFPGISGFSNDEAEAYRMGIEDIFEDTGRNLFSL